jgi:threonine/homoserine/homoserine lactone efflux protein
MTGIGLFGFMQQNPMVWVGLIQAYLLMALIAALGSLAVFESMGTFGIVRIAIAFHLVWLCLETLAAVYPDPSH